MDPKADKWRQKWSKQKASRLFLAELKKEREKLSKLNRATLNKKHKIYIEKSTKTYYPLLLRNLCVIKVKICHVI